LDRAIGRLFIVFGIASIDSFKCRENQQTVFQAGGTLLPVMFPLLAGDPGGSS
jgi:hypothetical protein